MAAFVLQKAEFVTPQTRAAIVAADPDDNKFLEAAVARQAEYVVSGDHHLMDLGAHQGIPIVTARDFIDLLLAQLPPTLPTAE